MLAEYVKHRAEAMGYNETTLPRACVSKAKLDGVLSTTMLHEKKVVPQFFGSPRLGEIALRRIFEQESKRGKFYDVDVADILASERWRKVFRNFSAV